jgi:hypothetical protein
MHHNQQEEKLVANTLDSVATSPELPVKEKQTTEPVLDSVFPNRNQKSKRLVLWFKLIKNGQEVIFVLKGQKAKTLKALIENGDKGCTALEISKTFALRLSEYIRALRSDGLAGGCNLNIITNKETNPVGWHGRYILCDNVKIVNSPSNENFEVSND